jgi:hypothetical protein
MWTYVLVHNVCKVLVFVSQKMATKKNVYSYVRRMQRTYTELYFSIKFYTDGI